MRPGPIHWCVSHPALSNLFMILLMIAGIWSAAFWVPLEVIPEQSKKRLVVSVGFPGGSPREVERSVIIPIEEAVHALDGISELVSVAGEGGGRVELTLHDGYDPNEVLDAVRVRVNSIASFPVGASSPSFQIPELTREIISILVSARLNEHELRRLGHKFREEITRLPTVSHVELAGLRSYELSIEVSEGKLQKYDLTIDAIVEAIRLSSVNEASGNIKQDGLWISLRTVSNLWTQAEFENIVVKRIGNGNEIRLGEIATVRDGFEDIPMRITHQGTPAFFLNVSRVGTEQAMGVVRDIRKYVESRQESLPEGITLKIWNDRTHEVREGMWILLKTALLGSALVLISLTLFLHPKLAWCVFCGIPFSVLATLATVPFLGVTLNPVSVFAFVLVIGMVVDDAIVTGECIYGKIERGYPPNHASIDGAREVLKPVTVAVFVTIIGFIPFAFVAGAQKEYYEQFPKIVIPLLLFSLIETKLFLPTHLALVHRWKWKRLQRVSDFIVEIGNRFRLSATVWLQQFVEYRFANFLRSLIENRSWLLGTLVSVFILFSVAVGTSRIQFQFSPSVESDTLFARVRVAPGTPRKELIKVVERMRQQAFLIQDEFSSAEVEGESQSDTVSIVGGTISAPFGSDVLGEVSLHLSKVHAPHRNLIASKWREQMSKVVTMGELSFGNGFAVQGYPVEVHITGSNTDELLKVAKRVKSRLNNFEGVFNVKDLTHDGAEEIRISPKPEAEFLGLRPSQISKQLQDAYYGVEVQRLQREGEQVPVVVRYSDSERRSLQSLNDIRISTPYGGKVPLGQVASMTRGREANVISRVNRTRTVYIVADVDSQRGNLPTIEQELTVFVKALQSQFPGVTYHIRGAVQEQADSISSLNLSICLLLLIVFITLSLLLKSVLQPLVVLVVLPVAVIGAILGHLILGMNLTMLSLFGMLAFSGVAINNSLNYVGTVNSFRKQYSSVLNVLSKEIYLGEAVIDGAVTRLRSVFLTTLTTVAGLLPILLDTSPEIRYFQPMAVSLAFGVIASAAAVLIVVPLAYLIHDDLQERREDLVSIAKSVPSTVHLYGHALVRHLLSCCYGIRMLVVRRLVFPLSLGIVVALLAFPNRNELGSDSFPFVKSDTSVSQKQLESSMRVSREKESYLNEYIVLGSFALESEAEDLLNSFHGRETEVVLYHDKGEENERDSFKVLLGPFHKAEQIQREITSLQEVLGPSAVQLKVMQIQNRGLIAGPRHKSRLESKE